MVFRSIKIRHSVYDVTVPIKGILGPIAIAKDVFTAISIRLVVTEVMELAIVSDI